MANRYQGLTFYEYHRQFSMNAAQLLEEEGIKVDWSVRDQTIFLSLFTGQKANSCLICASVSHDTHFCPETARDGPRNFRSGNVQSSGFQLKTSQRPERSYYCIN